jgi:hypothetical protein
VKLALRQAKQPVCLFGEDARARRARLQHILQKGDGSVAGMGMGKGMPGPKDTDKKQDKGGKDEKEVFYTHGCEELKTARSEIALYSVPKAALR